MTTTTKPATSLPRRTLPALRRDRPPIGLESLGEPWTTLIPNRDERFRDAVTLRSAYEQAELEIERAAERDREQFRQAALNDEPDPGRRHELQATAAAEAAYIEALTASDLANAATRELVEAVHGEPGEQLAKDVGDRIDAARARLASQLEPVVAIFGELAALTGIGEAVKRTRKADHGRLVASGGTDVAQMPPLYLHGNPVPPALAIELLRDYDPRKDRSDA